MLRNSGSESVNSGLMASNAAGLRRSPNREAALARAMLYAGWKIGESGASKGLLDAAGFAALISPPGC